jgi:thiol-disulfide isomerase/thioredoxin
MSRPKVSPFLLASALFLVMTLVMAAPHPAALATVGVVDGPGLKKAIAGQRGKVVLVNFWATWCQPCVEEFPDLVRLYNAYRARGLVVMAVSVDEPNTQSKVAPFLKAQKATFSAFMRKPGDMEAFINSVDQEWSGVVPITYLFDRSGARSGKPLIGAQSYGKLAAAVEPLLR